MKRLAAIATALLLSGCAGADYSPLQRDLQELAALPQKLDTFVKERTSKEPQTAAVEAAPPAPDAQQALASETTVAPAEPQAAALETAPPPTPRAPAKPAPTLLDRLRQSSGQSTAAQSKSKPTLVSPPPDLRPGVYDQIPEPIPVENPLARPPWEALAEAGPNADNELDLELLYGAGNVPVELQTEPPPEEPSAPVEQQVAVAQTDAPLALPPEVEPPPSAEKAKSAKPPSASDVVIKSVAVPNVTGAKGKGNAELTAAMRKALKEAGWPVSTSPRKDALTIQGRVAFGKPHGENQSVKIVWDVLTPDGKRLGDLKQDNAVPAGSLDQAWGENAGYAAEAAAEGIFKLIQKYR